MATPELMALDASPALRGILDAVAGSVQPPIRSEIFGLQRFAQHGRSLGTTHSAARATGRANTFFPRLRSNISMLRQAQRYIGQQSAGGDDLSPAAEWLLDNFHLIEAQLKEIHDGLPGSYFRTLPLLLDEPLAGLPRIYGVAWAFVAHTDSAFDEDLLVQFLGAYQETRELNLAEMWALPTSLRVVLIENLRRLAERVATHKAARELANLCCDRLDRCTVRSLEAILELLAQRGVGQVFLAQMAQRLQDRRNTSNAAEGQVLAWLRRALPEPAAVLTQQSVDQTADNLSVSNAVSSLRAIGDADWPDIVSRTSTLMQRMLGSRMFEAEHPDTRDQTLHGLERLARRSGRSEVEVADALLALMQADGGASVPSHWLRGPGRPALVQALGLHERGQVAWRTVLRRLALPVYLGSLALGSLGLVAWLLRHGSAPHEWGPLAALTGLLMLFPASEAVVAVINRLISESVRPQHLPRLGFVAGIPAEQRVLVVIPAMLTDPATTGELVHRLRLHDLANPEQHAQFALLTDYADADAASQPGDAGLLADAVAQIEALNPAGGPPRFLLLHRERQFSVSEQRWIGWERKRGKLEQLIALLASDSASDRAGNEAGAFIDLGALSRPAAGTPYIVTLDADTQLPPGRLRELVGVAAHPHNTPQIDASGRCILSGYGILQPRVVTPLPAPRDFTRYHGLFAGQCGIDPYSAASSEVYQDLFQEGTFTGKGLLNVRALHAVLAGRLPEGQVLSHDLLEGSLARCAAVTDITVIEDAPFHADVAAARVHRWTRGDWQLLPFLLPFSRHRLPLRAINRWKMFDNLRRSLVAPASLALLLLALWGTGLSPYAAVVLVVAAFAAGPLMGAVAGFSPSRDDLAVLPFYRLAASDLLRTVASSAWLLAQLLHQALRAMDAVGRALFRMTVSRRRLLQWTTAAAAAAQAQTSLPGLLRQHRLTPVVALLMLGAALLAGTPYPLLTALLCGVWAASPLWTWWVSHPRRDKNHGALPDEQQAYLAGIARDTWRLFERCITPADRHLPPDNLQVLPQDMLARRTSPTNIGLYLLSAACAREFGWIGTEDLLTRLNATLDSLDGLQRHRGHFMNWYDTESGSPLLPHYVSSVDSGNLSGHLLAVAEACRALARSPFDPAAGVRALAASQQRLDGGAPPEQLAWLEADHAATERSLALDAAGDAAGASARLLAAAARCEALAWAPDFAFLYHRKRHFFHLGYRVAEQQLDAGFYDLLASESRLTSLLAVAKGDVPVRHWTSLGRPFFAVGARAGLRSWSGSMFEYLMPGLVLDEPHGSVLRGACHAALREQCAFVAEQALPWGISESAFAGQDHTLAYQYAPQGVPRLALRRTPPDELVIAPYATALAAQVSPPAACRNFRLLETFGARGRYGFIEALDFSDARQTGTNAFTPVATFMAHHQGMSIVALANVLLGGVAQRWGMANAHVEAVSSLLHERPPREISRLDAPPPALSQQAPERRAPGLLRELLPGMAALEPTHLLSNGRYSVSLRPNGAGTSSWHQRGINRWRDDALRDAHGSFFHVRWDGQPRAVSLTQHPAPDAAAHYQSQFHADRVCFDASWPLLQAHLTIWVSPEDDIEFRQVELRNLSDRPLDIELISAFEVSLAEPRADEAHPAFSNMFVRSQWLAEAQALLFERQPRLPAEAHLYAAHFLAGSDPAVSSLAVQTDRQRLYGRNQAASQPLLQLDPAPAADALLDTGLDPVCALGLRLRIAPNAKALLTFATAASDNPATLRAVIDKYRQPSHVQRASLMSATLTGIRLRALGMSAENFAAQQTLTTALLFTLARPGLHGPTTPLDKRMLWRFGISGDRPLLLVSVSVMQGLGLLRALVQALRVWSWGGVACDLVVINSEPASYQMGLQRELAALRERYGAETQAAGEAQSGATLHLLRADAVTAEELLALHGLARWHLHADGRALSRHVQAGLALHQQALETRQEISTTPLTVTGAAATDVATGHFADAVEARGEFQFKVGADSRPQRPWINVLANSGFGAHLSEAGGGYTWALNSRLMQLSAWSNDPVADPAAETFLLQDLQSREVWSVSPSAFGAGLDARSGRATVYQVSHGQGSSLISHRRGDLDVRASWSVDADSAVKQVRISIVNRGRTPRQIRFVGIVEWLMGASRADRASTACARQTQTLPAGRVLSALLCTQRERSGGFGEGTAFLAVTTPDASIDWTCDRRECFDARGRMVLPDHFGQQDGHGLDPCAALSTRVLLASGESAEQVFLLGYAPSLQQARELAATSAVVAPQQRLDIVRQRWDVLLGATTVTTPDPLFDALVNRWLLYQTVSCRLWAKAGFYQAGGATGFRDQLQDSMALAWAEPALLREQIMRCAARQFPEGDVQHWWHAPTGAGVRTHFSDDLLWLPQACLRYLASTGDASLLDEAVPFIEGMPIAEGAEDAYYVPAVSMAQASIYEHAARALDHSLQVGSHGLPLMGSGDWNDGMNRVGIEGRGESVWLGWFLCALVDGFAPLAGQRGDAARASRWRTAARGWKQALLGEAWDGQWFKRAFFDDGSPLGSQANAEARIDLIAQAWGVLSNTATVAQQRMAMSAVQSHLLDADANLLRLLDPPLQHAKPSAGYIQAYPPGVRENGGQYTHAGVWGLMAQAQFAGTLIDPAEARAAGDLAWRYFTALSPAHRAQHPSHGRVYSIEPYVVAGDVYSQPPYVGRGGWSWYSGAAAWLHRAAVESIFGLDQRADTLRFRPCLPSHWPQAELSLRRDGRVMRFVFMRGTEEVLQAMLRQCDAQRLEVGEALHWQALAPSRCFVIPVP